MCRLERWVKVRTWLTAFSIDLRGPAGYRLPRLKPVEPIADKQADPRISISGDLP